MNLEADSLERKEKFLNDCAPVLNDCKRFLQKFCEVEGRNLNRNLFEGVLKE